MVKAARRGLGCGGKGAQNSSQKRRFLPPNHRYLDLCGNTYQHPCTVPPTALLAYRQTLNIHAKALTFVSSLCSRFRGDFRGNALSAGTPEILRQLLDDSIIVLPTMPKPLPFTRNYFLRGKKLQQILQPFRPNSVFPPIGDSNSFTSTSTAVASFSHRPRL